jgi:hypothetical protein
MRYLLTAVLLTLGLGVGGAAQAAPASRSAAHPAPVIGIVHSFGPGSSGWGHAHPSHLFNGGDPSGEILKIHWTSWGGKTARGHGKNPIFRPKGGYYAHPVTIQLRATTLTTCRGVPTYKHLYVREPSHPHGKLGKWRIWTSYHRNLCTRFE